MSGGSLVVLQLKDGKWMFDDANTKKLNGN